METSVVELHPPNSVLVVWDKWEVVAPTLARGSTVMSTSTSLAIITSPEELVSVTFGPAGADDVVRGLDLVFDGSVEVPSGCLVLTTVALQELAQADVQERARLRIFVDDRHEPTRVLIEVLGRE